MFNFFSKKHFLIDHLEGFIDIHNHILPGIDDGAKTVEDSIELIKGFNEFEVNDFICTPHIMENYYPNNPSTIQSSLSLLKNALKMNNLEHISIEAAAEHMIDSGFETILNEYKVMPLAKSYLLIEMSYLQASINFDSAVQKIKTNGLFPILAHPERYMYLHNKMDKYKHFKTDGVLFQLNLLSLGDYYGSEVQKVANWLLKNNLIDFAASDVHKITQLNALKKISIKEKTLMLIKPIIEKTIYNFK
ncbi:tyrosine-protein phosphatase [Maribacter sp. 1_2014MBL_MicDiv]|uniref:tyrosine-protein phosphatase n=1 Tax=Maribacter sp. 1_2014MBL_MicDiv TaxID=1644130 RepID=UPI0008F52347|nr:CpsB/CapC family capsule biosynthesis tyrosine phosphatase [Maribacter sp. 1_2014MBL_MicDiv]APA65510.1 histidinol phosphatase [Maribacter sp. 1_2014MBL_MicDiv]